VGHFLASVNELFEYALQDVSDGDMVGITIQNQVNQNDKPIGISFRRKDQLTGEVIWSVFEKMSQSSARFNVLDRLVVTVHSVKMPVGFGRVAFKRMGQTAVRNGTPQEKYREGEGRRKLFSPRFNNSDCESR